MSTSILEALQNANYNIQHIGLVLAKGQLHNAVVLLEKGYDVYDKVEPLLEKYGTVKNVPESED